MTDSSEIGHRILALDYGKKRIGVAVSDPFGNFAVGLDTLETHSKTLLETLGKLCQEYTVTTIVLGLPKHMKGHEGIEAEAVREFGALLSDTLRVSVIYLDERLTSVIAQQELREQGVQGSRNKGLIDQAAACRILQDYLNYKNR